MTVRVASCEVQVPLLIVSRCHVYFRGEQIRKASAKGGRVDWVFRDSQRLQEVWGHRAAIVTNVLVKHSYSYSITYLKYTLK